MAAHQTGLAEAVDESPPVMADSSPSQDISTISTIANQKERNPDYSVYVRGYPAYGERLRRALEDRAEEAARRRGMSTFLIREETYRETNDIDGPYSVAVVDFYKNKQSESGITPVTGESHQRAFAAVLRPPR